MNPSLSPEAPRPHGITAIGVFLLFGAVMAAIAGISLAKPGTFLDDLWTLNPRAYKELAPLGEPVGLLFLLLAVALVLASAGWLKRRRWGWWLAVVIIGTEVIGNLVSVLAGRIVQGAVGVLIAGTLLLYVTRPNVRSIFVARRKQVVQENRE